MLHLSFWVLLGTFFLRKSMGVGPGCDDPWAWGVAISFTLGAIAVLVHVSLLHDTSSPWVKLEGTEVQSLIPPGAEVWGSHKKLLIRLPGQIEHTEFVPDRIEECDLGKFLSLDRGYDLVRVITRWRRWMFWLVLAWPFAVRQVDTVTQIILRIPRIVP